jgi:hypothetical protein
MRAEKKSPTRVEWAASLATTRGVHAPHNLQAINTLTQACKLIGQRARAS